MTQLGGGNSQEIGGVHFRVGAVGAEAATTQINATAAATQNLGNKAQVTGTKMAAAGGATGVAGFTAGLKSSTKTFRDFTGAITGTLARTASFFGLFGLAAGGVAALGVGMGRLFDRIVKNGSGLRQLDEGWRKVREQQDEYSASIEKLSKLQDVIGGKNSLPENLRNLNEDRIKVVSEAVKAANAPDADGVSEYARLQALESSLKLSIAEMEGKIRRGERDRELGQRDIDNQKEQLKRLTVITSKDERGVVRDNPGPLKIMRNYQRESDEFTKRIAEALAKAMEKAGASFFNELGKGKSDLFSGDRVISGVESISDQLSVIALSGRRDQ